MTLADLVAQFREPHRPAKGGAFEVICPCHQDGTKRDRPSLRLSPGKKKLFLKCWAGCEPEAILQAVGLADQDLWYEPRRARAGGAPTRRLVETYPYHDEAGTLLFEVCRFEPKGFLQRRPDPGKPGEWIWNLDGVRQVPYRLPELQGREQILWFEGERHVDFARALGFAATTTAGGAKGFAGQATSVVPALVGAGVEEIVLFADHDQPGYGCAREVGAAWLAAGGRVRVCLLPGLPLKGDILNWAPAVPKAEQGARLAALVEDAPRCEGPDDLEALLDWREPDPTPRSEEPAVATDHSDGRSKDRRPTISVVDLDLLPLRRTLWDLLVQANEPPVLFSSGVRLARVRPVPEADRLVLDEHTIASFQARLADVAKFDGGRKRRRLVVPPHPLVAAMLAEANPPVPVLTRIVTAPLIGPDGQVVAAPGYHRATATYYAPAPGFDLETVPETPCAAAIAGARAQWAEIVRDFPFASTADQTHAVCAGLLPFGRDLVDGPTPIHLFEAPTWGSGKTLLASAVFYPFLGALDSVQPEPESSAEWRKRLTALLREGTAVAVVDNVRDELTAGPLMSFVTSQSYHDRILGETRTGHYVNRLVLAITGNNPILSGEALRRTVRIRLVPDAPQPWLRDPATFAHSDLAGWLRQSRAPLVRAALILWRAWLAAGRPGPGPDTPAFGKFERWRHVMGGLCAVAGFADFLGNLRTFYEEAATTDEMTLTFVLRWWDRHGGTLVVSVPTLFTLAQEAGLGFDARTHQGEVVRFGQWLVRLRDRLFRASETQWLKAVRTDSSHGGVRRWRLTSVDPARSGEPTWLTDPATADDAGGAADAG